MHLVGFTIEIYYAARLYERQTCPTHRFTMLTHLIVDAFHLKCYNKFIINNNKP